MSQITEQGGGGGPALKTLEHFFPIQIFPAIQFPEPPHTQLLSRGAATTLRSCRHPSFSLRHKLSRGKNHTHVQNVKLFSISSSHRSVMVYVVRKGWICAGKTGRASGWGKAAQDHPQQQPVAPAGWYNTEGTNLGPS